MGIPKIIHKGKNTYEFVEKVKDNMYLYQEKNCGYKTTFSNYDLGMVHEQMPVSTHGFRRNWRAM